MRLRLCIGTVNPCDLIPANTLIVDGCIFQRNVGDRGANAPFILVDGYAHLRKKDYRFSGTFSNPSISRSITAEVIPRSSTLFS